MCFTKLLLAVFFTACLFACRAPQNTSEILIRFTDSNENYGYKNLKGEIVLSPRYPLAFTDTFSHHIAFVADTQGIIAIDRQGKFVLRPFVADNAPDSLSEGLFRFVEKASVGFADADGNTVIPATLHYASSFRNGLAAFCIGCQPQTVGEITFWTGGKWGFIDKKGNQVIEPKYDAIGEFENGKARVMLDSAEFFIDEKGNRVE